MHDMYGSFDFVNYLLGEYDLREEKSLALRYSEKLAAYPELPKFMLNMKEFVWSAISLDRMDINPTWIGQYLSKAMRCFKFAGLAIELLELGMEH